MSVEEQREHLEKVIGWAEKIRTQLGPVLNAHGDRVHFRPGASGVAMVGLLPESPQLGKGGFKDLSRVARDFERLFAQHCRDAPLGRDTPEKRLQSFLISEAQQHGRRLVSLDAATQATQDPVELRFVVDEIVIPTSEGGKIVCDLLALRTDGGRSTPVLLELKSDRQMKRLIEQVEGYAALVDRHADLFARLYGALLDEPVRFDGPVEKWVVWPRAGAGPEPRERDFGQRGIRLAGYEPANPADGAAPYRFTVGPRPAP